MCKKYFTVLFAVFTLLYSMAAYSIPLDDEADVFFTFRRFNVVNGLSNNYVLDIVQDGQGFIWIGTESGLNRFDGKNFTVFMENNSRLINNAIHTLLYDSDENMLWIGTKNGVSRYNCTTGRFENFDSSDDIAANSVTHIRGNPLYMGKSD